MTDSEIDMMISEIDQMAQRIGCRFIPDPEQLKAFRCAQKARRAIREEYKRAIRYWSHFYLTSEEMTDLTDLPRKRPTDEIRDTLEQIVFTSARDWKRSIKIDRYVRDILVHALKLDETLRRHEQNGPKND